jgi:GT2 family glycosyltransferase
MASAETHACWLSDEVIVVSLQGDIPNDTVAVSLVRDGHSLPLEVRCLSFPRTDLPATRIVQGALLTIRVPCDSEEAVAPGQMQIQVPSMSISLDVSRVMPVPFGVPVVLHSGLAGLDRRTRARVLEFLSLASVEHKGLANPQGLSAALHDVREVLRERLPRDADAADQPHAIEVEAILAIDANAFYLHGSTRDQREGLLRLTAVSPEGGRTDVLTRAYFSRRPSLDQPFGSGVRSLLSEGWDFFVFFETTVPSALSDGWVVEMANRTGSAVETSAPAVVRDFHAARDILLGDLAREPLPFEDLLPNHISPALSRLQERHQATVQVDVVEQFGTPNETPDISIVVPLSGRIDFLEHQLAQFVHDPELLQADLIYVLDSLELAASLRHTAAHLSRLYRFPFRVVTLTQSGGYSTVNNVGASFARGRLLLLLNSDVFPDRQGWLRALRAFYDRTPRIGALAPKLLFEDGSIQHAGLSFFREAHTRLWSVEHEYKGLHRRLPAANVARPVPAVSAACLLVDKGVFDRLGGLQEIYVQGGYEDSDFCLRLLEAGYENWYLPDVELYHLEGQSYSSPLRQQAGRYNQWLHHRLWNERIETLVTAGIGPSALSLANSSTATGPHSS